MLTSNEHQMASLPLVSQENIQGQDGNENVNKKIGFTGKTVVSKAPVRNRLDRFHAGEYINANEVMHLIKIG